MPTKIATRFLTLGGLCLLAVTSSLSPGISRANLLINGSFEENPGTTILHRLSNHYESIWLAGRSSKCRFNR